MSTKLYYFNGRGLAEPIRMILAYGEIEYEDVRIPLDSIPAAIPPEIKAKCTWGQVPAAEIDGKRLCQSLAITRYFAKKAGLAGSDDFEAAMCDEYVDSIREMMTAATPLFYEKDTTKLPELKEALKKSSKEKFLDKFESIVQENGTGWLVGKKITWADIYMLNVIANIRLKFQVELLTDDHPGLRKLVDKVAETPNIKQWIDKRPVTEF